MAIRLKTVLLFFVLLQTQTCKKDQFKDVPVCILEKIKDLKNSDVANPPASVGNMSTMAKPFITSQRNAVIFQVGFTTKIVS